MKQSEKNRIEDAIRMLARKELVNILENQLGCACYDDEPLSDLQECLLEHMTEDDCYPEVFIENFGPQNTHSLAYTRKGYL